MNKRVFALVAAVGLVAAPLTASAQSDATPSASDMKGSPNASGYGKERGMEKGTTATTTKGTDERPATKEQTQTPK